MRPENDSTRSAAATAPQKVVAPAQVPPPAVRALPDDSAAGAAEPPDAQPGATANRVITADEVIDARGDKPAADEKEAGVPEARPDEKDEKDDKIEKAEKARADKREDKGADDEEREAKTRKVRLRPKREAAQVRARPSAADGAGEESDEADEDAGEDRVATAQPPRSSTSRSTDAAGSKATRGGSIEEEELEPLPVAVPEPAEPPRPKKPIIITPDRAIRQSGAVPRLRFPPWEQAPAAVAYKLCMDASGAVSSVTVLSKLSGGVRAAVVDGLKRWRYKPVLQAGQKVPACFATTFKVELK